MTPPWLSTASAWSALPKGALTCTPCTNPRMADRMSRAIATPSAAITFTIAATVTGEGLKFPKR